MCIPTQCLSTSLVRMWALRSQIKLSPRNRRRAAFLALYGLAPRKHVRASIVRCLVVSTVTRPCGGLRHSVVVEFPRVYVLTTACSASSSFS